MGRILLVDDDKDMLMITERWFLKEGYEVYTAASGREAIDILSNVLPDVILLDFYMPQMDGPEVLRHIRSDERTRKIPVLFRTGKDDAESNGIIEELSPEGVVFKTDGKKEVLSAVRKYMPVL